MAYKVIILYRLYMPSYFLGTFTEYPYVGASLVLHTYDYRKPTFSMTNSFGSLRIYMGFNFWKKKEYRDKKE